MTRILLLILAATIPLSAYPAQEKSRSIVSDDFTNSRPRPKRHTRKRPREYRLASAALPKFPDELRQNTLKVGVTVWQVQHVTDGRGRLTREVAKRVEAGTQFRDGDLIRLSVESPRTGYLYVVDCDWFKDSGQGEMNLIFPLRGEDNRLQAGKLIDIPAAHQPPFKTAPKLDQVGELLTIIITKSPLSLSLSSEALPVSSHQLAEWADSWSGLTERFEMIDGAGQGRTRVERQAASRDGVRQLTRDDPAPQTIYLLTPKSSEGLLFKLLLSYAR